MVKCKQFQNELYLTQTDHFLVWTLDVIFWEKKCFLFWTGQCFLEEKQVTNQGSGK